MKEAKATSAKTVRQLTELADQQKAELQSLHILLDNPSPDAQMEKFQAALKEKSDELIEVTTRLNQEIDTKDEDISNVEKQLLNCTNELEEVSAADQHIVPLAISANDDKNDNNERMWLAGAADF